jgi:hypothetical protein
VTLSSAYFERAYTNKQLTGFGLEVVRLGVRAETLLPSRWAVFLWKGFCAGIVERALATALRETGHGLRLRALYSDGAYVLMRDREVKTMPTEKDENFFKFFFIKLVNAGEALCSPLLEGFVAEELSITSSGDSNKAKDWLKKGVIFRTGGINNNIYLAELLSNQIFAHEDVPFFEGYSYITEQTSGARYAARAKKVQDELFGADSVYETLGVPATLANIKRAGWTSVALSGTTYYVAYSTWNALMGKEQSVRPFAFRGIRIPDTFSYLTTKGVSFRTISEYNVRDHLDLTFGAEYIIYGLSATEFNVGVKQTLDEAGHDISYACSFTFGLGLDVEASVRIPVSQRIALGADVGVYSRKSLLGERHSTNLRKEYGVNFSVSLSWMY